MTGALPRFRMLTGVPAKMLPPCIQGRGSCRPGWRLRKAPIQRSGPWDQVGAPTTAKASDNICDRSLLMGKS